MVAHEKLLVDKKMDTSLPKEPTPEISPANVPDSDIAQLEQCKPVCKINDVISKVPVSSKTSEERGIDAFLDNVNKKKVSDEIRKRKKEEKLQRESIVQGSTVASPSCNSEKENRVISEILEVSKKPFPQGTIEIGRAHV